MFISFISSQASSERRLGGREPVLSEIIITRGEEMGGEEQRDWLHLRQSEDGKRNEPPDVSGSRPDQSTSCRSPGEKCSHTPAPNTKKCTTSKCQHICLDVQLNTIRDFFFLYKKCVEVSIRRKKTHIFIYFNM